MHFGLSVNATRPIALALLREGKLCAFPPDSPSTPFHKYHCVFASACSGKGGFEPLHLLLRRL